ncbi:MAG: polyprenyl synthetase family protein [Candidatus Methanoplasma sp.]|nr:polyprenyl synthetase family protein [Candidatus Methanoplasma sp.]
MGSSIRSDSPELTEICEYALGSGGKKIRPAMCILAFRACGGEDSKQAVEVGAALEMIHSATLIHDDINDEGDLRRGAKVAYKRYSISRSIIAGDFLFAAGFNLIGGASREIIKCIFEAASAMGAGEFDQKGFEHDPRVTESSYLRIIEEKTARLIECAARSGAFLARADASAADALGSFAHDIGMAFQIVDDTLDVVGEEGATGKRIGSDIMEGKPTLPIIYAMQDPSLGGRIRELFESPRLDWAEAEEAISLIKSTDAIQRCLSKARGMAEGAIGLLDALEESEYKGALRDLARYIVDRDR